MRPYVMVFISGIFLAAAFALILSSAIAVSVGGVMASWVPRDRLGLLAGLGFIVSGAWMVWRTLVPTA